MRECQRKGEKCKEQMQDAIEMQKRVKIVFVDRKMKGNGPIHQSYKLTGVLTRNRKNESCGYVCTVGKERKVNCVESSDRMKEKIGQI